MSAPVLITAPKRINGSVEYGQPEGQLPIILNFQNGVADAKSIPPGLHIYLEKKGFTVEEIDLSDLSDDAATVPEPHAEKH